MTAPQLATKDLRRVVIAAAVGNVIEWYDFYILDRKSTRLNSSHLVISYAVFCLKKKDLQNTVQSLDAKISGGNAPPTSATGAAPPTGSAGSSNSSAVPAGAPSADTLYSNGLRDIASGKYDLARAEFQDYLKYYGETDLASNSQFYLGEIAYSQKKYDDAVAEYEKVLSNYPKSFKLAPARLKKGMALIELGQKPGGIRELREVVKRYPGTEEDRRARARLKELGVAVTATR